MLLRISSLLSVFWFFSLHAELGNEFPTVLASTEVDEGIIFNHCVNTVAGSYFEVKTDLVVRGPEPLILYHDHVSSDLEHNLQGGQWHGFADSITTEEKDGLKVYLHMADGASYIFSQQVISGALLIKIPRMGSSPFRA